MSESLFIITKEFLIKFYKKMNFNIIKMILLKNNERR